MDFFGHLIDGRERDLAAGSTFESIDPWRQGPWAEVALGTPDDVDQAVSAARRAFDTGPWPRMGFERRGQILHRLADLIEDNAALLGHADSRDMGKPTRQSVGNDVPRAAHNLRFFADHARLATADVFPMDGGHHAYTRYEPAGVVAAIAPWNFPLMLETWKIAPALAWGNTVVLKPAEHSPVSATLLARLALDAGVPPGVLNVVHGPGPNSVGEALTRHPGIDRITFTGESATGRAIVAAASTTLTPVSLELGGKGANLVFADADLDNAVDWSARAIFTNAGQVCLAGSRILVQKPIYEEFLARLVIAARQLRAGDPLDEGTDIGPLASQQHATKVIGYLSTVESEGGKLAAGGDHSGWTVTPTVVVDLPRSAPHWHEEIFGPLALVAPFDTEEEAVALANDTRYGLNAMVFTENLSRAHRVSAALRAGTVWVNCFFIRDLRAPFGGVADSGIGREGGTFSREFFTEPKAVIAHITPHPERGHAA